MDLNTCIATTLQYHTVAYWSHLVPIAIAGFLGVYALIKAKGSKLALVFSAFTISFGLWLAGDLVDWVSPSYFWVYFTWSWLDFVNVAFFVLGAFFFGVLARKNLTIWERLLFVGLCIPPFFITVTGGSVLQFTQSVCEAVNSDLLTYYKLAAEGVAVLSMFLSLGIAWKKSDAHKRVQLISVLSAILLFFVTFAGTEYYSSVSGVYEINLYSLFVLPIFLIVMVFSVTNLGVFEFRLLGTQIFSYVLIIMSGSQLLFIKDTTQVALSLITVAMSVIFGILLLQNAQREADARVKIEELAKQLESANKQQVVLIHFITHQIKGFVTKSRNIFASLVEGDYGQLPETMKPLIEEGFRSDTKGAQTIQQILDASNIKSGKMSYANAPFDLKELTEEVVKDLKPAADVKSLALTVTAADGAYTVTGDRMQMLNALKNLIDNSIKYTPSGSVAVTLAKEEGKIRFQIQDTGVGITSEDMAHLFTEGGHGKDSAKVNVDSTGFGLYIVKNIIEAHKGKVWAESEGAGKGSRFIVELPA